MSQIDHSLICDGCGVEIFWGPVVVGQRYFCCEDCANGRGCHCAERIDEEDERRPSGGNLASSE